MTSILHRAWIVVALVAVLPFAQTLPNPPVLDDGWAVVENPLVQGGLRNTARILTAPYNYGARAAALAVGRATWEGPTRTGDRGLFGALDAHARGLLGRGAAKGGLQVRARAAVAAALPGGEPTLAAVARAVGTSPRTLQRRLGEEGAPFASLVDAVRRERAEAYLRAPDVSVAEVSWLLGFAEQSAFTRAFRRWTGVAPTEWRRRGEAPRREDPR
jgi:AraC-like DNA-binding protein